MGVLKTGVILDWLGWTARPKGMVLEAATDRDGLIQILRSNQSLQNLVCCLHRHATEIRNKMSAVGVGSEATFYAKLVYFNDPVKR